MQDLSPHSKIPLPSIVPKRAHSISKNISKTPKNKQKITESLSKIDSALMSQKQISTESLKKIPKFVPSMNFEKDRCDKTKYGSKPTF